MEGLTQKFLNLFFNEGESICVSHNEYGYHSISQDVFKSGSIVQVSPSDKVPDETISDKDVVLVAMNPVDGFRKDANATAYRTFMVEMDDGTLEEQKKYVDDIGLPYSYCCYSGNKSLHFGIVLEEDIPSYQTWHDIATWILKIMEKADPMTKNPTRSIRFAGNIRKDGKKKMQQIIHMGERVSLGKLSVFLSKHPDKNPQKQRKPRDYNKDIKVNGIPKFVIKTLKEGVDPSKGRNNEWFKIGNRLAESGMEYEQMLEICTNFFDPEGDFPMSELESVLKSAYNRYNN